jgi:hypothetical protein
MNSSTKMPMAIRQDAALHEPILAGGDHHAANEVSREIARKTGIPEDMILKLYAI